MSRVAPVSAVAGLAPYRVPPPSAPCDLMLAGNEGLPPSEGLLAGIAEMDPSIVRNYPSVSRLQAALAERHGVEREQLMVTAGADDALDRTCRALLGPDRGIVLPLPTFEMLHVYAKLANAQIRPVDWPTGPFPTSAVLAAIEPHTVMVAIISPNNPTGAVAQLADLEAIAARSPVVLLDHAYVEFADEDLTQRALELGNVLVFRTLSKAWGLAGLRVGYVLGSAEMVGWLRRVGNPYPVSSLSVAVALQRLATAETQVEQFIRDVRMRRSELEDQLRSLVGDPVLYSQANFVFTRFDQAQVAEGLRDHFARHGIAIRGWPGRKDLETCLRITVPSTDADHQRVRNAIGTWEGP